jgi:N-formylglutamate amidohydrolase
VAFTVTSPSGNEIPLVVEVPHAGLELDAAALATLTSPARCIGNDADLLVDRLYQDAPELGATLLVAHTSRYVLDLNRSETDVDSSVVEGVPQFEAPHGLIWTRTTEGHATLDRALPQSELQRRISEIHRPYHQKLWELLVDKRHRFGFVVLLCAHSMPSSGRSGHGDPGSTRADVVPGSRGRTTAHGSVIDLPEQLATRRGWSVLHDIPYRGGYTTGHYGRPAERVHAVQVELNRRIYMDEAALVPRPGGFEATREYCRELVRELGALRL